ncbi:MAG: hypothetical protein KGH54_00245 [Candidatus Micrarchaeota archaeon]|nr:hypothetical protein [Candidatus Micrarchaeota archaeon]
MADASFKDRIKHLQISTLPLTDAVRNGTKSFYSSISQAFRRNDTAIVNAAQNLAVSGDGCGICPSCVVGNSVLGFVGIKYYLEKNKIKGQEMAVPQALRNNISRSASLTVFKDDAFRCC